jgi:hypothetical protein
LIAAALDLLDDAILVPRLIGGELGPMPRQFAQLLQLG